MCMTPFHKTDKCEGVNYAFPCGKCPECTARRVSAWSFRLMQENKRSISAHFITLTYDTQYVPITKNGFMSVNKQDVQKFFKRLRKLHGYTDSKIKYYAASEYGGRTSRPHYHIIIFNCRVELLQPAWHLGNIHYGSLTEASVGYTLKYIHKPKEIPKHANDDRLPEFSLMSKRLGDNYLTPQVIKWHKNDLEKRMHLTVADGKKVSMPRYYKDKMYNEDERAIIAQYHIKEIGLKEDKFRNDPNYDVNEHNRQVAKQHSFILKNIKSYDKL